jgi:xanthine dehydrogenase accessory factor
MDSVDLEVLRGALAWLGQGRAVTLATVVRTWGSAPRPPGAWAAIRDDGAVIGSVSGGCVEADLIARVREGRIGTERPTLLRYGVTREEAARFGLPCGGTLEIVLEPRPDAALLGGLADRLARHELVARVLSLADGEVALAPARRGDALQWDGARLTTIHGPRWRLLVIGAGQTSRVLAEMARALDYEVTVCDPREEFSGAWDLAGVRLDRGMPDDVVLAMEVDPHTAIVALTHDPKLDDLALLEALKSPAFYVGALGSRANDARRRQRLREHFDLSADELARLHGPVGLRIGSRTPAEIAVAILAEMIAVKNGVGEAAAPRERAAAAGGCALA